MGKQMNFLVFPGGKSKAFTLSYDDGVVQDRRLAELLRSRGLKCTFNIGSGLFGHVQTDIRPDGRRVDVSKLPEMELEQVYVSHEIGGHGLYHSPLDTVGTPLAMYEITEDKRRLEALVGRPMKMFAYPFGTQNAQVQEMLRLAGYRGARTVKSTHDFEIPEDFLEWNPTCHHADPELMVLAQRFVDLPDLRPALFYVWGHGYEFDGEDNWGVIEALADFIASHSEQVWFATNGEILDYVQAFRRLEYSVDGSMVFNPSALDVTVRTSFFATETIPAGRCIHIAPTPL